MKTFFVLAMVSILPLAGFAADEELMTVDEMIDAGSQWVEENIDPAVLDAGQRWAEENIDERVLAVFKETDRKTVVNFLNGLLKRLQGDDIAEIGKLKPMADIAMTLLEAHPETQPYASWLRTRQDYFEVAKTFRPMKAPQPPATVPPVPEPGRVPAPEPNPPVEEERKAWKKALEKRTPPKGAAELAARLKPVFAAQQVPTPLVWLAEVESSFAPGARSPSGAAGLYQLMPATAKGLGLSLFPRDQRLNPERNAKAAARYLKALHVRFKDWRLALAAYNAGEGRVSSLMKKHKAPTYEELSPHLPAETQMYIPKIDATLLRREGIGLADLRPPT